MARKSIKKMMIEKRNPSANIIKKRVKDLKIANLKPNSQTNSIMLESSLSGYNKYGNNYDIIEEINEQSSKLPHFETAKTINKKFGPIEAFVVNTHKGIIRSNNEDRVSILLNAQNKFKKYPENNETIQFCSMFSVFDGHGGINCCNFLKEKLHEKILENFEYENLLVPQFKLMYKQLD